MGYYEETKQLENKKWQSYFYDGGTCIYTSDEWESEYLAKVALTEWKIQMGIRG